MEILTHIAYDDNFQAWNTQTNMELSLSGPVGQVYALVVGNELLFAGTQVIPFSMTSLLLSHL